MPTEKRPEDKTRLEVYLKRFILVHEDGDAHQFDEGNPTAAAKKRLEKIKDELANGFLTKIIAACKETGYTPDAVDEKHLELLTGLVDSVTSEVGRAIVGLSVLQFCMKAVTPNQSIRLHTSGGGGSNFSWCEGVPMRVLDKNFISRSCARTGC